MNKDSGLIDAFEQAFKDGFLRIVLDDAYNSIQGDSAHLTRTNLAKVITALGLDKDDGLMLELPDYTQAYDGTVGEFISGKRNMSQIARMLKDIRFQ